MGASRFAALAGIGLFSGLVAAAEPAPESTSPKGENAAGPVKLLEASVASLRAAYEAQTVPVSVVVEGYLEQIRRYDSAGPSLNAIAATSEQVLVDALAQNEQQKIGVPEDRPLFGIPIIVKDNIQTGDLPVTAGSKALLGFRPREPATIVRKLRDAGALILATANMHEFAYGIESVGSAFGAIRNPYDTSRHPGGSSGGTAAAIAAGFAVAGIGTDTCGSVRNPAAHNALVGVRGTQGLVSRAGIVPLSLTQDIAGPLARSVADAAVVLDALVGFDPADPQTAESRGQTLGGYAAAVGSRTLAGARFGVVRQLVQQDPADAPMAKVFTAALEILKRRGATVVDIDPLPLETLVYERLDGFYVLSRDFAQDIDSYLNAHPDAPVGSLVAIVRSKLAHPAVQPLLLGSLANRSEPNAWYLEERLKQEQLAELLQQRLAMLDLDALLYPTIRQQAAKLGETQGGSNCHLSANSGLPSVSVPMGYTADGMPAGLELLGARWSERTLLALAAAFEAETRVRRAPKLSP